MTERGYNGNGLFWVWGIVVLAMFGGAFCFVQHGDSSQLTTPPERMTPEQIDVLELHVVEAMQSAGWKPEQIQCVRRHFNCDYRPGTTEGCDELEPCGIEPQR